MKVLNLLFDERIGGPQLRVIQVAAALRFHDIETIVVIPEGDTNYDNRLSYAGISHMQIPLRRIRKSFNPFTHTQWVLSFGPTVAQLVRIIRLQSVDIVYTNGIRDLQAALVARLTGTKLIWHLNDISTPRWLARLMMPWVNRWSDQVVASSNAAIEYYSGLGLRPRTPPDVLYAPVDMNRFNANQNGSQVRSEWNLEKDAFLVGTIGNFSPVKGYEYFVKAAGIIAEHLPDSRFVIVGEELSTRSNYVSRIRASATTLGLNRKFIFAGRRSDIPEVLAALDIYVQPSLAESLGMAAMEACAMQCPVVASAVGGLCEIIVDQETGMLVPPGDPAAIANAVLTLANRPRKAAQMGQAARERMNRMFSLDRCVQRHIRLYQRVLDSGHSASQQMEVV